jgi:uncharacterized protein with HEPN domain
MRLEAKKYGCSQVDHRIVWDIVESKLSTLRREVAALLKQED